MSAVTKAPVDYLPNLLDPALADKAFDILDSELPWARDDLPRDEVYFNDTPASYTYGSPRRPRTYVPEASWHTVVADIRVIVESALDLPGQLDVCFCNRYIGPRDALGWHADDSPEMDPERPIVTVSLGAVRDIEFRRKQLVPGRPMAPSEHLNLGHGSAAVMKPGMQALWQHRIPKSSQSNIETRISLTFRGYLPISNR